MRFEYMTVAYRQIRVLGAILMAAAITFTAVACGGNDSSTNLPGPLQQATEGWNTNWEKHSIEFDELLSGGPPRDGIPSLDDPSFVSAAEAGAWLADNEPVIALELAGEARAYPIQILTWHEIANDTIGDTPVAVTFCPLCNASIVFNRELDGEVYEFGTSGLLRKSDLVMYDRTSESLWQQFTGEAIIGDLTGKQLDFIPSSIVSFADFKDTYPEGTVLSQETGFDRAYGTNPYPGYDDIASSPFLFDEAADDRIAAMERVVAISVNGIDKAYSFSSLEAVGAVNDSVGGIDLVVFHSGGTSSALDTATIAEGADVGAAGVFEAVLDGQKLTFTSEGDRFIDDISGSSWNILGEAIAGPMEGKMLTPVVHGTHFWFAWAAFKPETLIYEG